MPAGHEPGKIGMVRRVVLNKDDEKGLGLAVVGGKQLGVPILGNFFHSDFFKIDSLFHRLLIF